MKVVLITDNHAPEGGAENYFFALKEKLKQHTSLEIYSIGFGKKAAVGVDFTVFKGIHSKAIKLFWQFVFHPIVYFKFRRLLKKLKPDVIHLHHVKQFTPAVMRAIKPYPLVQTIHDYGVICPTAHNIHKNFQPCKMGWRISCFWQHQVKHNPFIYFAMLLAFFKLRMQLKKHVDRFLAPSPLLVDYLKTNGFHPATYIPPFKSQAFHPSFAKRKTTHFLFAGNLGRHKGVHLLIDEFALALLQNNQLTLTIAGEGPEKIKLQQKVTRLHLGNHVHFVGWQTSLSSFYEECTAVIFPSLWMEAFGLIITEAMSHARPVIGSNRGSPPWIIDDHSTGTIFNPLEKGDLAHKMLWYASHPEDAKIQGMNGFQKLKTFIDNEETIEKIVKIYEELI